MFTKLQNRMVLGLIAGVAAVTMSAAPTRADHRVRYHSSRPTYAHHSTRPIYAPYRPIYAAPIYPARVYSPPVYVAPVVSAPVYYSSPAAYYPPPVVERTVVYGDPYTVQPYYPVAQYSYPCRSNDWSIGFSYGRSAYGGHHRGFSFAIGR